MDIIGPPVHFGDTSQLPDISVLSRQELDFSRTHLTFGQEVHPGKFAEIFPGPTDQYQAALVRKQHTIYTEQMPHSRLLGLTIEQFGLLESYGVQVPAMYFIRVAGHPFRPREFRCDGTGIGILTVTGLFKGGSELTLKSSDPAGEITCNGLLRYLEHHMRPGAGVMLHDIFHEQQFTSTQRGPFLHDHDLRFSSDPPRHIDLEAYRRYLLGWRSNIHALRARPGSIVFPSSRPLSADKGPMAQIIETVLATIGTMDQVSVAAAGLNDAITHAHSELQSVLEGTNNAQAQAAIAAFDNAAAKLRSAQEASTTAAKKLGKYGPLQDTKHPND
jgi:hypothetical protein